MHSSSLLLMGKFVADYADKQTPLSVLDVGSMDVNGAYKPLFSKHNYQGLDVASGKNVDIVSQDLYNWPVKNDTFDIVVSGQCMEHVSAIWLWVKEIERVCKPGGLICIIAPWNYIIHRYPVDCWRILPDGMEYILTQHCSFKKIKCEVYEENCYFIGTK